MWRAWPRPTPARATKTEDYAVAVEAFDQAIAILERQAAQDRRDELQDDLANVLRDKALALAQHGQVAGRQSLRTLDQHLRHSIALYDRAITLYDRPGDEEALHRRAIERARCLSNQGNALWRLGDAGSALRAYDAALADLDSLERQRFERELAVAWMNKGVAHGDLEGEGEAMVWYGQADEALKQVVRRGRRRELTRELALCAMNQGCALAAIGDDLTAIAHLDRAVKLYEQEVYERPPGGAHEELALCYMNKAAPVSRRGQVAAAIELLNRALQIFDNLARHGRPAASADLGLCWMNLGTQLWRSGQRETAMETYDRAVKLLDACVDRKGPSQPAADLAMCHLNAALAYHELQRPWRAGRALRRAGQLVLGSALPDARLPAPDAALKALFDLFSKHRGRPDRAEVRRFLARQTAASAGGAVNRTHKRVLDLS
jgi:tetratricopeptide (TPR) repeat protein